MRRRRLLYGWLRKPGEWCLGRLPPDSPQTHYAIYHSMHEAESAAEASRYEIIWAGAALETRRQLVGVGDG
jgi:hypothetical protein